MADLTGLALTISGTLLLQGVTFVVLEYPEKLKAEQGALEADQRQQLNHFTEEQDAINTSMRTMDVLLGLHVKLLEKQDTATVDAVRNDVRLVLAQLRGLEVTSQPFASNIEKQRKAMERALEIAKVWDGSPSLDSVDELDSMAKTLLISAMAVKRANDNNLEAFWSGIKLRAAALRGLSRKYVVSSAGLALAASVLFSMSMRLVSEGKLLRPGTVKLCWACAWLLLAFAVSRVAYRVLKSVLFAWKMETTANGHLTTVERRMTEMMPGMAAGASSTTMPGKTAQS